MVSADEGWFPWIMPLISLSPHRHHLVEITREEWGWGAGARTVNPRDLPPEMNVSGLYWRVPRKFDNVVTLSVVRVER